jgi:ornithine decarboxylase
VFIVDLDEVYYKHMDWLKHMPNVRPFYAMKSNDDINLLKLLAHMQVGFDCASKAEIERLLDEIIGVEESCFSPSERIIFANPIKKSTYIRYAHAVGVRKLIVDNEHELVKVHKLHPSAQCLLRIRVPCMPAKFGASVHEWEHLIRRSLELGVELVGAAFYVGFRQKSSENFLQAIGQVHSLFELAETKFALKMSIVDIGGGFPGTWQSRDTFIQMSGMINATLRQLFPQAFDASPSVYVYAEPGTYYSCAAYSLCAPIISKRVFNVAPFDDSDAKKYITDGKPNRSEWLAETDPNVKLNNTDKWIMYSINDSSHASFKWYDLELSIPVIIRASEQQQQQAAVNNSNGNSGNSNQVEHLLKSCVSGPTCDSTDLIFKRCYMPELNIGDHLMFRNMGSYTKTCAVPFNRIPLPTTIYVSSGLWKEIVEPAVSNSSFKSFISSHMDSERSKIDENEMVTFDEFINKLLIDGALQID